MEKTDRELLEAIARGDRPAFEQLYRQHKDRLLTAAVYLTGGDRAAAEDVLHDVFVALAERAGSVKLHGSLRNYLLTACHNRVRDTFRTSAVSRRHQETVARERGARHAADSSGSGSRDQSLIDALAGIPAEQREVVTLHVHGELSFREIAEMLGLSTNTVQSRYRYALAALRRRLAGAVVSSEE